jgi:hypothetical protein
MVMPDAPHDAAILDRGHLLIPAYGHQRPGFPVARIRPLGTAVLPTSTPSDRTSAARLMTSRPAARDTTSSAPVAGVAAAAWSGAPAGVAAPPALHPRARRHEPDTGFPRHAPQQRPSGSAASR